MTVVEIAIKFENDDDACEALDKLDELFEEWKIVTAFECSDKTLHEIYQ